MKPDDLYREQYVAMTERVGVADLTGRTILTLTGPDRPQFLHSFCTNDVKRLVPGSGCEAFITSPQGKTLGYVYIFCEPNQHVIDTAPDQAATLLEHFHRYIISEDVEFADRTAELGVLLLSGPQAATLLQEMTGTIPPTDLLAHSPVSFAGCNAIARRVDYTDPDGYFIQVSRHDLPAAKAALLDAGAPACNELVVESRRLERGTPLSGRDITIENLPQEVGRDAQAISFTKGCYLGQETVARIDALGHVNRLLVGVRFDPDSAIASGTPLHANGQQVGQATSSAWSFRLNAPLALAFVRRMQAKPGSVLSSPVGAAEVVRLPIV